VLAYAEYSGADLSFQNFQKELETFKETYGLPHGSMVVVEVAGKMVGVVGLRYLSDGIAEMKRMFVLPAFQGLGLGQAMLLAVIDQAKALGYQSIRLDTIPELDKAINLYRKFHFQPIAPYRFNPHPDAQFYELSLDRKPL